LQFVDVAHAATAKPQLPVQDDQQGNQEYGNEAFAHADQ
jgi:hypothetical protein